MPATYTVWNYKGSDPIGKTAQILFEQRTRPTPLAPLIFMTDRDRTPDIINRIKKLPPGAAIIYRHFGADNRYEMAKTLRQLTFVNQQQLLIGNDPELAIFCGADGVHFRRDPDLLAPILWRSRCPAWIISMAGLKGSQAYRGDLSILDGLLISSVFPSRSPSAGHPLGLKRFTDMCRTLPVPVMALGGIDKNNAGLLNESGAAGLAGVQNFGSARS